MSLVTLGTNHSKFGDHTVKLPQAYAESRSCLSMHLVAGTKGPEQQIVNLRIKCVGFLRTAQTRAAHGKACEPAK